MITFSPENHKYTPVDPTDTRKWLSASKIPSLFKKPFDEIATSEKAAKNKKSKWYGMDPEVIREIWKTENLRSTTLGTWYHDQQEKELLGKKTAIRYGKELTIFRSIWENGIKIAPDQKMEDGIYPEHLVYLNSRGICGQFDEPIVCDGYIHLEDHKSNKDLKKPAYVNWEGETERLLSPLRHLEATKLTEYALQLSIGMYMMLRHNPQLKAGDMFLNHVTFELEGENEFGYPILKLDENQEPILKGVERIPVPYLKREVEIMFNFINTKREQCLI